MANTLAPETEWYAVNRAKLTAITVDNTSTTTYASTGYFIPGCKSVGITPQANVKDLTGDSTLLDRRSIVNTAEVKLSFAKFSFNVYPILMGGTATSSGVDPSSVWTWDWGFQAGSYFKLEATLAGVDPVGGDAHITLWKCNLTTPPPLSLMEEDFTTFEATGSCYKRLSDGKAVTVVLNQTAAALS
jgi:hypothetical protein